MAKILVVEDDESLADQVKDWLVQHNFVVETAGSAADATARLSQYKYDVVVLDWTLPDSSGIDVLKRMREEGDSTTVLMLTGKDTIDDKETGFDSGADDYLTKPFDLRELTSRLRALMRRTTSSASDVLVYKHVRLDPKNFEVRVSDKRVNFHAREFALLEHLLRHPGQVFSAEALLDSVWDADTAVGPETVRQCVKRIRKKIDLPDQHSIIENIYGVGYRLKAE